MPDHPTIPTITQRNHTIDPRVVSPSGIARDLLDDDAVRTVERLAARGYEAYFVGGCVRDILLGHQPKDFDIATAARPQQVKRSFARNCRIIGRRFKLAHLHFDGGRKILEVSTFRRSPEMGNTNGDDDGDDEEEEDLLIVQDNEFGTAEEDAVRRDFTVNALFFDPIEDRLIDYVGGIPDLEERVIRTIGDPMVRFREDPVRILRAAKFTGRLGFHVEDECLEAMAAAAPDLARAAPPRLLEEILRLLRGGHAFESFQMLRDVRAIPVILPLVGAYLDTASREERLVFWRSLEALDGRIHAGEVPSSAVLLATLFYRPVAVAVAKRPNVGATVVAEELLGDLTQSLRLPRRDAGCLKRICGVQGRFTGEAQRRFRPENFVRDPFFPAALELFEMYVAAVGADQDIAARWRELAAGSPAVEAEAEGAAAAAEAPAAPKRKRRRRGRGRNRGGGDGDGSRPPAERQPEPAPAKEPTETRAKGKSKNKRKRRERADRETRERRSAPEVIEPEAIDRSVFDRELDPRRVPTFGALVEQERPTRRRRNRLTVEQELGEGYRPPPPGGGDPEAPPPPPPPPRNDDVFGDW